MIIAEDIDGEALAGLIVNKARGTLQCAAIKNPGFGKYKKEMLDDIAILTGGTVVNPQKGLKLEKFESDWFGTCKTVTIDSRQTILVDGAGTLEEITKRIDDMKGFLEFMDNDYDVEQMQRRLGKLGGGVAIIKMGADSELEMKEKRFRVEDALNATRAALDEGLVSGGGTALIKAASSIEPDLDTLLVHDQQIGYDVVIKAIKQPFDTIMKNAGLNSEVIWEKIQNVTVLKDKQKTGFDARNEEVVDMFEAGIIDPAKVTRVALEKAASVAGTMLITDCVIVNADDEKQSEKDADMMGGGFGLQ